MLFVWKIMGNVSTNNYGGLNVEEGGDCFNQTEDEVLLSKNLVDRIIFKGATANLGSSPKDLQPSPLDDDDIEVKIDYCQQANVHVTQSLNKKEKSRLASDPCPPKKVQAISDLGPPTTAQPASDPCPPKKAQPASDPCPPKKAQPASDPCPPKKAQPASDPCPPKKVQPASDLRPPPPTPTPPPTSKLESVSKDNRGKKNCIDRPLQEKNICNTSTSKSHEQCFKQTEDGVLLSKNVVDRMIFKKSTSSLYASQPKNFQPSPPDKDKVEVKTERCQQEHVCVTESNVSKKKAQPIPEPCPTPPPTSKPESVVKDSEGHKNCRKRSLQEKQQNKSVCDLFTNKLSGDCFRQTEDGVLLSTNVVEKMIFKGVVGSLFASPSKEWQSIPLDDKDIEVNIERCQPENCNVAQSFVSNKNTSSTLDPCPPPLPASAKKTQPTPDPCPPSPPPPAPTKKALPDPVCTPPPPPPTNKPASATKDSEGLDCIGRSLQNKQQNKNECNVSSKIGGECFRETDDGVLLSKNLINRMIFKGAGGSLFASPSKVVNMEPSPPTKGDVAKPLVGKKNTNSISDPCPPPPDQTKKAQPTPDPCPPPPAPTKKAQPDPVCTPPPPPSTNKPASAVKDSEGHKNCIDRSLQDKQQNKNECNVSSKIGGECFRETDDGVLLSKNLINRMIFKGAGGSLFASPSKVVNMEPSPPVKGDVAKPLVGKKSTNPVSDPCPPPAPTKKAQPTPDPCPPPPAPTKKAQPTPDPCPPPPAPTKKAQPDPVCTPPPPTPASKPASAAKNSEGHKNCIDRSLQEKQQNKNECNVSSSKIVGECFRETDDGLLLSKKVVDKMVSKEAAGSFNAFSSKEWQQTPPGDAEIKVRTECCQHAQSSVTQSAVGKNGIESAPTPALSSQPAHVANDKGCNSKYCKDCPLREKRNIKNVSYDMPLVPYPICWDLQVALIQCYQDNPGQTLNCAQFLRDLQKCTLSYSKTSRNI